MARRLPTPYGTMVATSDLKVFANRAFENLFGFSPATCAAALCRCDGCVHISALIDAAMRQQSARETLTVRPTTTRWPSP